MLGGVLTPPPSPQSKRHTPKLAGGDAPSTKLATPLSSHTDWSTQNPLESIHSTRAISKSDSLDCDEPTAQDLIAESSLFGSSRLSFRNHLRLAISKKPAAAKARLRSALLLIETLSSGKYNTENLLITRTLLSNEYQDLLDIIAKDRSIQSYFDEELRYGQS